MGITYLVRHVISLADVKFAKGLENAYAQNRISLGMCQALIPFMLQMEELSPLIALEVEETLHRVLLRLLIHVPHHLHVAHAAGVVEQELIQRHAQEVACPHGLHIIIARETNVLIVVAIQVTCTTSARLVTYPDIKPNYTSENSTALASAANAVFVLCSLCGYFCCWLYIN